MFSIQGEDTLPDDIIVLSVSFTEVNIFFFKKAGKCWVNLHSVATQAGKKKTTQTITSCWIIQLKPHGLVPWPLKAHGSSPPFYAECSVILISHKVIVDNLYSSTASYFGYSFLASRRAFQLPIRKCFAQGNDSSTKPIKHLLYPTPSFSFYPIKLRAKVPWLFCWLVLGWSFLWLLWTSNW